MEIKNDKGKKDSWLIIWRENNRKKGKEKKKMSGTFINENGGNLKKTRKTPLFINLYFNINKR